MLGYSTKNIPIPSRNEYLSRLLEKVESVIKRMRWKAFFFDKSSDNEDKCNEHTPSNYGLKSRKTPPKVEGLSGFEADMFNMIENIQYRPVNNSFQANLRNDIRKINASEQLYIAADKTRNLYKMDRQNYKKLLTENITKKYKHAESVTISNINREFDNITQTLDISDRIDKMTPKAAFITLKVHKDDFEDKPTCRLINPSKSEVGKISKLMLERINNDLRKQLTVNQWRSTKPVLEWFNNLQEKQNLTFLVFDIVDYYPSISENLLKKSLSWAKQYTIVTDVEYKTIMHSRRSLLFDDNGKPWVKTDSPNAFDVTMGGYDGAEICELVGLLILQTIQNESQLSNLGLYRDDGLAVLDRKSACEAERIRKGLVKIFHELGLRITVKTNLKITNYLDATLNLNTSTYKPYRKPNDQTMYINVNSNHPPAITKQIPRTVGKRISLLSSTDEIFAKAAPTYNKALEDSNYTEKIEFHQPSMNTGTNAKRKNRSRNTIWFNPPYSKNIKSNVGKEFLNLLKKHFPTGNRYHKLFNKNNVKVSYSCMKNINAIIQHHNSKIIAEDISQKPESKCNCRNRNECPLEGNCLTQSIVYEAAVHTDNTPDKTYIGLTGGPFKERYANHKKSFKHSKYEKDTELSKYIWELKRKDTEYTITWRIIRSVNTHRRSSGQCNLCIAEKLEVLKAIGSNSLNRRNELISKCRHPPKWILARIAPTR